MIQERATVTQQELDVRPNALVKTESLRVNPFSTFTSFIRKTLVIAEVEARKLRHDPSELITRAVQPALWLVIFGEIMASAGAIPTGNLPYLDFLTPGILAQSCIFIAIFSGMTIIWERDLGIVHKFLASPTPRGALSLGKSLSGGIRALSQAVIVYILAVLLGVKMNWHPLALLGVLAMIILGAAAFSAFSLIIALIVKTRDRFMGIGQVLTMPIFFASSSIYPISIMPKWLKCFAKANPLTYEVDALRTLILAHGSGTYSLWLDFSVLLGATVVLVIIAGWLYPRAAT
jgi:ABC-2 type transport system permease protein